MGIGLEKIQHWKYNNYNGGNILKILGRIFSLLFSINIIMVILFDSEYLIAKNKNINIFMHIFLIIEIIILSILFCKMKYSGQNKKLSVMFFLIMVIILFYNILVIGKITFEATWKTQKILFKNKHLKNYFIEFQMQDVGAFGYRSRTVAVIYITKNLMYIKNVVDDRNIDNKIEWERIDKEINEMGFDSEY
jgi:hypothetical protein